MGVIKARCTSLAINTLDPETEYIMVFIGDKNRIKTFKSNMPDSDHAFIDRIVKNERFTIPVSNYEADPNTMLNAMGMLRTLWRGYPDKCAITTSGADEWGVDDRESADGVVY